MHWAIVVALVIAIPIIVFPVVFIWYLNIKGIHETIRETRKQREIRKAELRREDRGRRLAGTGWQYIDAYLKSSVAGIKNRRSR